MALFEQHDLAQHTSSAGTKLIHGGLQDLETHSFRSVREALTEREILLRIAPHIVWPLEFWLPHARNLRPAWRIRLGLWLYDHLARRDVLPSSRGFRLKKPGILKPAYRRAFSYADCWVEDSRLAVLNAMDAASRGAKIFTRTKVLSARPQGKFWQVETEVGAYTARAIVNATGPWVGDVLNQMLGDKTSHDVRLVKGSHIITDRLYPDEQAFILQNSDKRVVFVIPYERDYSLIGSTESAFDDDPAEVTIADDEIEYLCASVNRYFKRNLTADDVLWTYSGVQPRFDGSKPAQSATRDHVLELAKLPGSPPVLSVFGGKMTTYRKLAEQALEALLPALGRKLGKSWTATAHLPGGDIQDFGEFEKMLRVRNGHLDAANLHRLAYSYGTLTERFVGYDMGEDFGGGLHRSEVDYLVKHEWARTSEDILWRRTKLGLHVPDDTPARLSNYLSTKVWA